MIDFRYHALSLAAVLIALALGVLLGVAIGDTNLVSSAKSGVVHNLDSELAQSHRETASARAELLREEALSAGLYPLAVHELLSGREIGLVFLGSPSNEVSSLVRAAVAEAGGEVATVVAVREPLELGGIAHEAAGTRYTALASSPTLVEALGELVARQLVSGGQVVDHELISRVRASLLSAFDGELTRLEGIVVMRAEPPGMSTDQSEGVAALESGLLAGVNATGVAAVGVELTGTSPSQISWYRGQRISSVDDLNRLAGQAALDYALAGYRGTFGVKSTAASLLPSASATAQP